MRRAKPAVSICCVLISVSVFTIAMHRSSLAPIKKYTWPHASSAAVQALRFPLSLQVNLFGCNVTHDNATFLLQPIAFSIPRQLIASDVPLEAKSRNFASIVPGRRETYKFSTQNAYYNGYRVSKFGVTFRKGGFDCMRHLGERGFIVHCCAQN